MRLFEIEYVEKLQWDLCERGQAPWEASAASGSQGLAAVNHRLFFPGISRSRLWGQAQQEATEKARFLPW